MKICTLCGQDIPQPVGRLICSQCNRPILRKSGGWTHGPDGRPRHNDCNFACVPAETETTMDLLPPHSQPGPAGQTEKPHAI